MKTFKIITLVVVLTIGSLSINAQQVPMYSHYMNNTLVVNPAYAGSRDALTVTALDRMQWVDFKGAPVTQTLTMHTPLRNEHLGLGLSIINDKIGPTGNTSVYVEYAYIMELTPKSKLSFGLSAGADIFRADLNTLQLDEQIDPVFLDNIRNKVTPNFGFGAYYYRESFYAGISAPNLMQNNYSAVSQENGTTLIGKEQRHYFFIAGAMINLTNNLAFKPTTLIKVTSAAPAEIDLTASFVIMKKISVGAMYRSGDAYGGLVGLDITDQLNIGYSYDWSYGLRTGRYNAGSHEIMLRYDFIYLSSKQIHSPRYF